MIENELRSLLAERAGAVPDNPDRVSEVRSRIGAARRRRLAGAALGVVLLVVAGFLMTRLPSANESLPPGVPAPPYFNEFGAPTPIGYSPVSTIYELTGPLEAFIPSVGAGWYSRHLIVTRCERPGVLTVRNAGGPAVRVDCSRPVGDHFEGAVALEPARAKDLLQVVPIEVDPDGLNISLEPGSAGRWLVAVLQANAPESLPPLSGEPPLADGAATPDGTTVEITLPAARAETYMSILVECVAGVRLAFSVPAGQLGTADCDPTALRGGSVYAMTAGRVAIYLSRQQVAGLGLRPGDRVPLTIRSVGRDTDQWRVVAVN